MTAMLEGAWAPGVARMEARIGVPHLRTVAAQDVRTAGVEVPVGRESQRSLLASVVQRARSGDAGVVVVRGAAGSGKSLLLDGTAAAAGADCTVVRAGGVEAEIGLPFGALQQLCGPLADVIGGLPAPQADALGVAFGLIPGTPADPFLVGVGLVSLLSAAAVAQPVVCVIDDVHWMDPASAQSVGFAARRLAGSGVAFVMAVDESVTVPELAGLPEVRLAPLSAPDAHLLLTAEMPGCLHPRALSRILAEARGNPQVIGELARSTSVDALAGGFGMRSVPEHSPVLDDFVARLGGLSGDVRTALLLAAAEPFGDPDVLRRAATAAGVIAAVTEAEATGLVRVQDWVLFCHPVARLAVYDAASNLERQAAHRFLAAATRAPGAPAEDSVWHQGQGATDPVEEVADALEQASPSALERGGYAAAAAFLERAAKLSEDPSSRVRRLIAAGRMKGRTGAFDAAEMLLSTAERERLTDADVSMVRLVRAETARSTGVRDAAPLLLAAADRLAATDPPLSHEVYLSALDAMPAANHPGVGDHAAPPSTKSVLVDALASRLDGTEASGSTSLADAVARFRSDGNASHRVATRAAMELFDVDAAEDLSDRSVALARMTGSIADLPAELELRACVYLARGAPDHAEHLAEEAARVAAQIGIGTPLMAPAHLAGWRCPGPEALEQLEGWSIEAGRRGDGLASRFVELCTAMVNNGLGRYDQALAAGQQALRNEELFVSTWAAAEVVEAAVRAGEPEHALDARARIRSIGRASGTDWALGVMERCDALTSDTDSAEPHFLASIQHLERSRMTPDRARTQLLFGEWLRRQKRRVEARVQLARGARRVRITGGRLVRATGDARAPRDR